MEIIRVLHTSNQIRQTNNMPNFIIQILFQEISRIMGEMSQLMVCIISIIDLDLTIRQIINS